MGRVFNTPRRFEAENHEHASQRSHITGAGEDAKDPPVHADMASEEGSKKVHDVRARGTTVGIPFRNGAQRVRVVSPVSPRKELMANLWRVC